MSAWRSSASLILAGASTSSSKHGFKFDYRLLMMKRAAGSSFWPHAMVFPGGTLDPVDYSLEWTPLLAKHSLISQGEKGLLVDQFRGRMRIPLYGDLLKEKPHHSTGTDILPGEITFRLCALRETFEETGLLICVDPNSDGKRVQLTTNSPELSGSDWQERVKKEPHQFLTLHAQLGLVPDLGALHEWANHLTPFFSPKAKRFDTVFYFCSLPTTNEVTHDNESEEILWASPIDLLSTYLRKERMFGPPQLYELGRLTRFSSVTQLGRFAEMRAELGSGRCLPVCLKTSDCFMMSYPGDARYPHTPDPLASPTVNVNLSRADLDKDTALNRLIRSDSEFRQTGEGKGPSHGSEGAPPWFQVNVPIQGHVMPVSIEELSQVIASSDDVTPKL